MRWRGEYIKKEERREEGVTRNGRRPRREGGRWWRVGSALPSLLSFFFSNVELTGLLLVLDRILLAGGDRHPRSKTEREGEKGREGERRRRGGSWRSFVKSTVRSIEEGLVISRNDFFLTPTVAKRKKMV